MQHNTIASVGRQCLSLSGACKAAVPGSCRKFSCRPTMKLASSTPSISSHCHLFGDVSSIATQSTRRSRLWQERTRSSVACTTWTASDPASSPKSCTSPLGAIQQHHISFLNHNTHLSLHHRQIRQYTTPRDYASKLFTDKNGSVVGPKTAGTRVLLVIGSVVLLWFVLNYAIGAAIVMVFKGVVKVVWGAVWWVVSGILGALRAVLGL